MHRIRRLTTYLLIVAFAIASTACASLPRKLALVSYHTSKDTAVAQTLAKDANVAGVLKDSDYSHFLDGAELVNKAGIVYSKAVLAYLSERNTATGTALSAALAGLVAAFTALPATVTDPVKPQIQTLIDGSQKVLDSAQKAVGP